MKIAFLYINELCLGDLLVSEARHEAVEWAGRHGYRVDHCFVSDRLHQTAFTDMLADIRWSDGRIDTVIALDRDHVRFGRLNNVCDLCEFVDIDTEEVLPKGTVFLEPLPAELSRDSWAAL